MPRLLRDRHRMAGDRQRLLVLERRVNNIFLMLPDDRRRTFIVGVISPLSLRNPAR